MSDNSPLNLGKRERQLTELLYRLGEASVSEVRRQLPDPPSYSAVRAMLNLLVQKNVATVRRDGKRYLYKPAKSKETVRRSVLRGLVRTFFGSEPLDAVAALIDGSAGKLSESDIKRLREMIDAAEVQSKRG